MKISENGLKLIKKFEGLSLKPYLCSAGVPTIGWGNTFYENMKKVTLQDEPITEERANSLFNFLVTTNYVNVVNRLVIVDINQNQFDALVSFVYNLGSGNFEKSTLLYSRLQSSAFLIPVWYKVSIISFSKSGILFLFSTSVLKSCISSMENGICFSE